MQLCTSRSQNLRLASLSPMRMATANYTQAKEANEIPEDYEYSPERADRQRTYTKPHMQMRTKQPLQIKALEALAPMLPGQTPSFFNTPKSPLPRFHAKDFARLSTLMERQEYAEALKQYRSLGLLAASVADFNAVILLLLHNGQGQEALNEYERMTSCGLQANEMTYALLAQMKTGLNLQGQLAFLDFLRRDINLRRLNPFTVASIVFCHMCSRMNELYGVMERKEQQKQSASPADGSEKESASMDPSAFISYAPVLNDPSTSPAPPIFIESLVDLNKRLTSKILPLRDNYPVDLDDPNVAPVFAALKAIGVHSYFLIYNTLVDKWSDKQGVALPRQSIVQYTELHAQGKVREMDSLVLVELREMSNKLMRTAILESLLLQAHSLSPRPNLFIYNSIMEHVSLDSVRKTNQLMSLLSRVKSLFPSPSLYSYNIVLYHCVRWQPLKEATEIIAEVEKKGMAPPLYRESWMVPYHAKLGHAKEALSTLHLLQEANKARANDSNGSERWREDVEEESYNALIEMYSRLGDEAGIGAIFDEMRERDVSTGSYSYNMVLDFYAKRGQLEKAERLFAEMRACKYLVPDHVTWGTMADMYVKANEPKQALAMIDAMAEAGCAPKCATFNILIDMYSRLQQPDKALAILDRMEAHGLAPDEFTLHTLIFMFGKLKNYEKAFKFFAVLKERGVKPKQALLNLLIALHARRGDFESAFELWNEMEEMHGLTADVSTFNPFLAYYGHVGQLEKMWRLYRLMDGREQPAERSPGANATAEEMIYSRVSALATCIVPDLVTYTTLFALGRADPYRSEMARALEDMKRHGLKPTPAIYTAVMSNYVNNDECERALELFSEVKEAGYKSLSTYVVAMRACLKRRDQTGVHELWEEMKKAQIEPDERVYNLLLQTHATKTNPSEKLMNLVFEQMKKRSFPVDSASYHLAMHAFTKLKSSGRVIGLYQQMLGDPVTAAKIDSFCLTAVLIAYCRTNNLAGACEMYAKLIEMQAAIRSSIYSFLLSLCHRLGDTTNALKFYNDAKAREVQFNADDYSALIQLFASSPDEANRQKAHGFLMEMKERGLNCPRPAWTKLVRLYASQGQLDVMMTMFEWMKLDESEEKLEREITASEEDPLSDRTETRRKRVNPLAIEKAPNPMPGPASNVPPVGIPESTIPAAGRISLRLFLSMLRACITAQNASVTAHLFREMEKCQVHPDGADEVAILCNLFLARPQDEAFLMQVSRLLSQDPVPNAIIAELLKHYVAVKQRGHKTEGVS